MTPKIKIFFISLAILAIVSVFSFFDIFSGVRSANLFDPAKPLPIDIIQDADQDGLSDSDESYWGTDFENPDTDGDGFLDGEEVASGNDPREKSTHPQGDSLASTVYGGLDPNDIDVNYNITDGANQLIAGAITSGDLTRTAEQSTKDKSVDMISVSAIDNFYTIQNSFTLPAIRTTENSKENQIQYLNELYAIVKNDLIDFPQKLDSANSLDSSMPYFSARGEQFNSSFNKAVNLAVPKEWLDIHKSVLNILRRFGYNYSALSNYQVDSVKALVASEDVANLNFEARAVIQAIQVKANANSLVLDDNIYKILDILYKE